MPHDPQRCCQQSLLMLLHADVCWRMPTYADVCRRLPTYARLQTMPMYADEGDGVADSQKVSIFNMHWRMLTLDDVCWRMLTYADVCWRMLQEVPRVQANFKSQPAKLVKWTQSVFIVFLPCLLFYNSKKYSVLVYPKSSQFSFLVQQYVSDLYLTANGRQHSSSVF